MVSKQQAYNEGDQRGLEGKSSADTKSAYYLTVIFCLPLPPLPPLLPMLIKMIVYYLKRI